MAYCHPWNAYHAPVETPSPRRDFDAARGVVYSIALSVVFVWLPILYVVSRFDF